MAISPPRLMHDTVNAGFTSPQMMPGSTHVNSLTLSGSGGIANVGGTFGLDPVTDSVATLTVNSGGILATSGTTSIGVGALTADSIPLIIHLAGAGTVLQLNSPIVNETSCVNVKADAGTLLVNVPAVLFRSRPAD